MRSRWTFWCAVLFVIGPLLIEGLSAEGLYEAKELGPYYGKCLDLGWTRVKSSGRVCNLALERAADVIEQMTVKRPDIRERLSNLGIGVVVIARGHKLTEVPEYAGLNEMYPGFPWDQRPGVGATRSRPVASTSEANMLQLSSDPYLGQFILVHEFGHTIMDLGLEPEFSSRVGAAFSEAKAKGLWKDTYAGTNPKEYWAEGVTDWFDCNREASPADGIHNSINTQAELREYDPALAALLAEVFDANLAWDRRTLAQRTTVPGSP